MLDKIKWQGGGSFRIDGEPTIQIAPWRVVRQASPPDIILIGHDHFDHCSPADVAKLRGAQTTIIGSQRVAEIIEGTIMLREWQSIRLQNATIRAVPAISRRAEQNASAAGGLGFVVSIGYYDIYYVGDARLVAGMEVLRPDIVLLPIDGSGQLSIEAALELIALLQPRWAIPYNWGGTGPQATELDARSFQSRAGEATEVRLLQPTN
ncbi:MAG: MBL fold metallo-hydrolase [Chloroflexi bacterium]|nr:MBL fold metallo-hydrolase [Chloroflexota bacterium]MCY4246950.1 MBL fold metallo-hydrolase [Chloroflexota bacterium]